MESPEINEVYIWSHLRLAEVEAAYTAAMTDLTVKAMKRFCQELRSAKLRYWREDRQMPGGMDAGARKLLTWAEALLEAIPESPSPRALDLVRGGIAGHRDELAAHLQEAISERPAIVGSFEGVPLALGLAQ